MGIVGIFYTIFLFLNLLKSVNTINNTNNFLYFFLNSVATGGFIGVGIISLIGTVFAFIGYFTEKKWLGISSIAIFIMLAFTVKLYTEFLLFSALLAVINYVVILARERKSIN